MRSGEHVLLSLVESMLDGKLAEQYYITGSVAGIYSLPSRATSKLAQPSTSSSQEFSKVNRDTGIPFQKL
ncbi:MAG TPA: hypothetical protein K8U78_01715 [Aeriscardovia aeriphila]|uniref:Uncharacterized protein n=1 Tax=Aeriscardovia aeriphila TaxID=218139 RepID=A0A921FW35_9BIFI|nr:hypothetical protein [Aeriscardovia aeriphila]